MPNRPPDFSAAFHRAARVTRAALYGADEDPQLPLNLQADARVPFLGFCGPRYERGGVVLLAINPGGGGDSYATRTPQDRKLIPLIEGFAAAASVECPEAFGRMCESYASQVQSWNLWRILLPTLNACDATIDNMCYLNIFPYRTVRDVRPSTRVLHASWHEVVEPLLGDLQPSLLIALGKKAGGVAAKFHQAPPPLFVVPRTIGDSYISEEAERVLNEIRTLLL